MSTHEYIVLLEQLCCQRSTDFGLCRSHGPLWPYNVGARVRVCVSVCIGTFPSTAAGWTCTRSTDGLRGLLHKEQPRPVENQDEGLPGCWSASVRYETRGKVSLKKSCLPSLAIHRVMQRQEEKYNCTSCTKCSHSSLTFLHKSNTLIQPWRFSGYHFSFLLLQKNQFYGS